MRISMGIISSLPKSITKERTIFEKYENEAYDTRASPKAGPILLKQEITALTVVKISFPSNAIRNTETKINATYTER